VHGDKYDYSNVYITKEPRGKYIYTVANDIKCKCKNVFKQLTHLHLNGMKGCGDCKNKTERKVMEFLKT